jgi:hypothetical protein
MSSLVGIGVGDTVVLYIPLVKLATMADGRLFQRDEKAAFP